MQLLSAARTRACPWEWDSQAAPDLQSQDLSAVHALAGTLRHVLLVCSLPRLVHLREDLFDAAEALVSEALTPLGEAAEVAWRARPWLERVPRRPDRRRPREWQTSSGQPSATRWPCLHSMGWLLPLNPDDEAALADPDVQLMESAWDTGAYFPNF